MHANVIITGSGEVHRAHYLGVQRYEPLRRISVLDYSDVEVSGRTTSSHSLVVTLPRHRCCLEITTWMRRREQAKPETCKNTG